MAVEKEEEAGLEVVVVVGSVAITSGMKHSRLPLPSLQYFSWYAFFIYLF